jgi:hypothetical protein
LPRFRSAKSSCICGQNILVRPGHRVGAATIYYDNQPEFYLEGLGISGLTFKPFAKLRLASNYIRLHVELDEILKPMSKSKKRKAIRYGKIPKDIQDRINIQCWQAVKHYMSQ